jgi:hypothetical protein
MLELKVIKGKGKAAPQLESEGSSSDNGVDSGVKDVGLHPEETPRKRPIGRPKKMNIQKAAKKMCCA